MTVLAGLPVCGATYLGFYFLYRASSQLTFHRSLSIWARRPSTFPYTPLPTLSSITTMTPRSTETLFEIASDVIKLLRESKETLAVAESLTGGGVMLALTAVPGASDCVRGGVVSYTTPLKESILGVDGNLIAREGVVHAAVAAQMAEGARRVAAVDGIEATWGLGTTGVAGPDKQGKDVGTVFLAVAASDDTQTWGPFSFPGSREQVRQGAVLEALARLRQALVRWRTNNSEKKSFTRLS